MTPMWPDVNDLDDDERRAVDVITPPPAARSRAVRRWSIAVVVALVVAVAWRTGAVRPDIDNVVNGTATSFSNDTGVLVVETGLHNAGVAPVRIAAVRAPSSVGTVTDVTIDGAPLPATIAGGETATLVVTVQSGPPPCSAVGEPSMILRTNVAWLPFDRDASVGLGIRGFDSFRQDWCARPVSG